MVNACQHFGGRERVEVKLYATLLDFKKQGLPQVQDLPDNASDALSNVSSGEFQEWMFTQGRALDTALPRLLELSEEDISKWSKDRGESICRGTNGDIADLRLTAVINLQKAALEEVMSSSEKQDSAEERKEIEALRSVLQGLSNT